MRKRSSTTKQRTSARRSERARPSGSRSTTAMQRRRCSRCGLWRFLKGGRSVRRRRQFSRNWFGAEEATKPQLAEILRGNAPGGPPALLFTGSHGAEWPMDDPAAQRQMQGALVTQEFHARDAVGKL